MKIIMLFLMFFVISGLFIISNGNLHMGKTEEFAKFSDDYYAWLENLFNNIIATTGQVVNLEWLPQTNETAADSENIAVENK